MKKVVNQLSYKGIIMMKKITYFPTSEQQIELRLVKDGRSCSCIIGFSRETDTIENFALLELQKYLKEITGMRLPLKENIPGKGYPAIVVGTIKSNPLLLNLAANGVFMLDKEHPGPEGFIIKTLPDKNMLVIGGSDSKGVLYGVYTFLEDVLGCCWYAPDDEYTIPKAKSLSVKGLDIRARPHINTRGYFGHILAEYENVEDGILDKASTLRIIDWMGKNKLNYFLICDRGNHVRGKDTPPMKDFRKYILPEAEKRGIRISLGQHLTAVRGLGTDIHYAPLLEGERKQGANPCFSNPEVIKIAANNVIKFFKDNPYCVGLHMWGADGGKWCECELCQAKEPEVKYLSNFPLGPKKSSTHIKFLNAVIKKVKKVFPDKTITGAGYTDTIEAPSDVKADPNIQILWCPFYKCYKHTLYALDCRFNRQCRGTSRSFQEGGYESIGELGFYEGLKSWIEYLGAERIMFHEHLYTKTDSTVFPFLRRMQKDYAHYYHQLGIRMFAMNGYPLPMYVYARLCWNVDLDIDELIDDICEKYYGESGWWLSKYYKELEDQNERIAGCWIFYRLEMGKLITDDCAQRLEKYVSKAEHHTNSVRTKKRVAEIRAECDRAIKLSRGMRHLVMARITKGRENLALKAVTDYKKALDIFQMIDSFKFKELIAECRKNI